MKPYYIVEELKKKRFGRDDNRGICRAILADGFSSPIFTKQLVRRGGRAPGKNNCDA